jgi:sugar phosphate isomerase/epimerase
LGKRVLNSLILKNYRGRFPFKLATTSYIYPDEMVPNVVRLGPFFDEIELVLFESERPESIPDSAKIDHLIELSKLHQLGFNIHLPLDISLGDECDDIRTHGTSITKTVIQRTLPLNPSLYTLHLDFLNSPTLPLLKGGEGRFIQEKDIEAWRRRVSRSLKEILNNGIQAKQISIETLAYPFEWIEDIVKEFGLSICLDIGHILTQGYDLRDYLKTYLPGTSIIHLHGVHKGSDHLGIETLPATDLDLILSALRHYHGIVSIEVFSINALKSSLSILEEKWTKS